MNIKYFDKEDIFIYLNMFACECRGYIYGEMCDIDHVWLKQIKVNVKGEDEPPVLKSQITLLIVYRVVDVHLKHALVYSPWICRIFVISWIRISPTFVNKLWSLIQYPILRVVVRSFRFSGHEFCSTNHNINH